MKQKKTMKQLLKEWDTIRLMVLKDLDERYHCDFPLQCENPENENDVDKWLYAHDCDKTFDTESALLEWIRENYDDFYGECPRWAIYYRHTPSSYLNKRVFYNFNRAVETFNTLGRYGTYYRSFEKRY